MSFYGAAFPTKTSNADSGNAASPTTTVTLPPSSPEDSGTSAYPSAIAETLDADGLQSFYYRARRRRNRDLRDLIRAQPNAEGILDLALSKGDYWDPIAVSTAMHTAARKCREDGLRPDFEESRWKAMLELLSRRIGDGEARNLANNVWSLATLACQDWPLIGSIAELVTVRACEFNIQEVSNTVWAFATIKWQSSDAKLYDSLIVEISKKTSGGVMQDLTNTMWALATLQIANENVFEQLYGVASQHVSEFKPQELSNTIWSMATVTLRNDSLAFRISRQTMETVPEFIPQNLANFIWAYAKLGYDDESIAERVQMEALDRLESFSSQDLSTTLWAFATLAYRHDPFLHESLSTLRGRLRNSSHSFQAQHISNVLWSLATVSCYDQNCFVELTTQARASLESFKAQELSNTIWACAVATHRDNLTTDALAREAANRIAEFDTQGIGNTIWAAVQLDTSVDELYRAIWTKLEDPAILAQCSEKCLSMLVFALFKGGRLELAWTLFERLEEIGSDPGVASLGTWLHWCRQRLPEPRRELRVMARLARRRPCRYLGATVLIAAAGRLAELGQVAAAAVLLERIAAQGPGEGLESLARRFQARLVGGGSSLVRGVEGEADIDSWLEGLVGWQLVGNPHPQKGPRCDYDKECQVLRYVLANARPGDPDSVVRCIESFSEEGSRWLKIAGADKGAVLDDLVSVLTPCAPRMVVEFGCYVGYSSCRMARLLRPHGGHMVSVEVDPIHACIARCMHEFAGLSDNITVYVGHSEDAIPHLREAFPGAVFDAIFMDQKGTRFHLDLETLESQHLLGEECVVLADNVLKPGAPHFLWRLQRSARYNLSVVSLREFAAESVEDWMSVATLRPGLAAAFRDGVPLDPELSLPPHLSELAFHTDRARARSCSARLPGEVGEEDWACHSHHLRRAYAAAGITPRIVEVQRPDGPSGTPVVEWPQELRRRSRMA
eukprot:TRINITY_DN22248_c0_g1_i1.p1 TRINITY_DN22248_c0_g1~~TRINITY_DN22248_c0_g1_i1.p1  ORF type:complete len:959 (-),score=130.29 TRINITY_DN22248_c0_g1_i1:175-3051(-)